MNVFESLIEELREENLLEATVMDLPGAESRIASNGSSRLSEYAHEVDDSEPSMNGAAGARRASNGSSRLSEYAREVDDSEPSMNGAAAEQTDTPSDPSAAESENERDFYRKRAVDEVSSLQMVEHVLSGIEREHMKIVPAAYDDLAAKKALHAFLQVEGDETTSEYAEAEFHLMRETEMWSTALATRDGNISVANLRRFCENSRPALSSQALMALARFYRNSAFSELTRAKFDFVMTRLFSREIDGEKRRVLFSRGEMVGHIKTLYANWASVALYSADDIPLKSKSIVTGVEDRLAEAESALTFDQLIENDFFKKTHEFKEATGEIFFTPEVVAATIDCNTKIGNKFVDLIRLERERTTLESVEQKYGYEYDQVISEAAGKTLHLVEVLKNVPESDGEVEQDEAEFRPRQPEPKVVSPATKKDKSPLLTFQLFAVNKWLLMATIVAVLVSAGLYFWSNDTSSETSPAESATDISLENSPLKEYVKSGRGTSETFYAITLPSWDQLPEEKKRELLKEAIVFANKSGLKNVQFINVRGRSVAYASEKKVELLNP